MNTCGHSRLRRVRVVRCCINVLLNSESRSVLSVSYGFLNNARVKGIIEHVGAIRNRGRIRYIQGIWSFSRTVLRHHVGVCRTTSITTRCSIYFVLQLLDEKKLKNVADLYTHFQSPESSTKMWVYVSQYRVNLPECSYAPHALVGFVRFASLGDRNTVFWLAFPSIASVFPCKSFKLYVVTLQSVFKLTILYNIPIPCISHFEGLWMIFFQADVLVHVWCFVYCDILTFI